MCNLYSLTKSQAAIIALTRAMRDTSGNLPPMPGVFPDYFAPIVRNAKDGVRELALVRWGMPPPPAYGGAPITNIRNVKSPHWRAWLWQHSRCCRTRAHCGPRRGDRIRSKRRRGSEPFTWAEIEK